MYTVDDRAIPEREGEIIDGALVVVGQYSEQQFAGRLRELERANPIAPNVYTVEGSLYEERLQQAASHFGKVIDIRSLEGGTVTTAWVGEHPSRSMVDFIMALHVSRAVISNQYTSRASLDHVVTVDVAEDDRPITMKHFRQEICLYAKGVEYHPLRTLRWFRHVDRKLTYDDVQRLGLANTYNPFQPLPHRVSQAYGVEGRVYPVAWNSDPGQDNGVAAELVMDARPPVLRSE
jgi:hypothetical protein